MTYRDLAIIIAGFGVTALALSSMQPRQKLRNTYRLFIAIGAPVLAFLIVMDRYVSMP